MNPTLQIPESKTECWGIIGWCSQKHMQLREEKELIPVLFPRAVARGPIEAFGMLMVRSLAHKVSTRGRAWPN